MTAERRVAAGDRDEVPAPAVTCAWCGTTAEPVPVSWTMQVDERGVSYMCEACTRTNMRAIEGRLPTEWW